MRRAAFLMFCISLAASGAAAASLDRKVAEYFAPSVNAGDFNGTVVIARGDKVLLQRSWGKADWDLNVPLAAASRFRVASITKTFTAAAVAILAERGKLSLGDPLSKYVPGFPNADKITIRLLLRHESGVPNPDAEPCGSATLDDLVAELTKKPLWFEPGKGSGYSNGGYALLARVIERASGQTFDAFVRDNIFRPLALTQTTIDRQGEVVPMLARGFVPSPQSPGVQHAACEGAWAAIGSGSVISSARDLLRWGRAVRNETLFKGGALEHYGWGVRQYFGKRAIEQSGIVNGYTAYLAVYPDDDLYVVALSNLQGGRIIDIGKGLAALALGAEPPALAPPPAVAPSTADERKRWLGRFRNDNIATVEISERESTLYLRWENSPESVFIGSTGPSTAYDRQDAVALQLAPGGDPLRMRWGTGEWQDFKRLP